jgi:DNA ligase-associated metallophosphoesterase
MPPPPAADHVLTLGGETLVLAPERAAFHPASRTLFAADLHLGKHRTFRAHGIALPGGSDGDLARLSAVIARFGAARLVVLGDLLHGPHAHDPEMGAAFAGWRAAHSTLALVLVRGNHDYRAGDPPAAWQMETADAPLRDGPFILLHDPAETPADGDDRPALAGHIHPAAVVTGRGRQAVKLPCFWLRPVCGRPVLTLPAFSAFTGGQPVARAEGEQRFAVADSAVLAV